MRFKSSSGLRAIEMRDGELAVFGNADPAKALLSVKIHDGIASFFGDDAKLSVQAGRKPHRNAPQVAKHPPVDVMDDTFVVSLGAEHIEIQYAPYDGSPMLAAGESLMKIYAWVNIVPILVIAGLLLGALGWASMYYTTGYSEPVKRGIERIVTEYEQQEASK